jgi:hypothetical protein
MVINFFGDRPERASKYVLKEQMAGAGTGDGVGVVMDPYPKTKSNR